MLIVNDDRYIRQAEIIWEKGTNRAEFFRGMVNKYGWVDTGSSFLPSEINAAFLYAQIENLDVIQARRKAIWQLYHDKLSLLAERGLFQLPDIPDHATNNAHMFYIVCRSLDERTRLIAHLKSQGISAVFHYLSLHLSDYYKQHSPYIPTLPHCDHYADCLLRFPMYYELEDAQVEQICKGVKEFFGE